MTVTVYGSSDDLIEVEGDLSEEFTALTKWGNHEEDGGLLAFSDGTILRIVYGPNNTAVWRITLVRIGEAKLVIDQCTESDDEHYSDRATLSGAQIEWVVLASEIAS